MKHFLLITFFLFSAIVSLTQSSGPGSGRCLIFSDVLSTQVNIPDAPTFDHPNNNLTIESWIYPTAYNSSAGVVFSKHETGGTREYTLILLPDGRIRFDVFDNASTAFLTYSVGIVPLNTWTHIAGTYSSISGLARIYINGILDVSVNIGALIIASTTTRPLIGAYWLDDNGVNSISRSHFIGSIDEVRLWHVERTQTEIRDNMCRTLMTPQPNLIAYYRLDEANGLTAKDASGNGNNGTLQNFDAAQIAGRSFSGAPIGNASTYLYTNSWSGVNLNLNSAKGSFTIGNISNTPAGFHLYRVDTLPNSKQGISDSLNNIYYGTFIVNGPATTYTAVHDYNFLVNCLSSVKLYNRDDNSDLTWIDINATDNTSAKTLTRNNISSRGEFILDYNKGTIQVDLGNDTSICNGTSLTLDPGSGYNSYVWQDGTTNQTFSASTIGKYWVTVGNSGCVGSDTINVINLISSPVINFGNDTSICEGSSFILDPGSNYTNYKWQDNSTSSNFLVSSKGIYWVTVSNNCGTATDSIEVSYLHISAPNLITPNNDFKNDSFVILGVKEGMGNLSIYNRWGAKVYFDNNYKNDWQGNGLVEDIYYYNFDYAGCGFYKGWVQLLK